MPIPLLYLAIAGLGGAYVGSQIDDAIDAPKQTSLLPSGITGALTILALGLGGLYVAKKTGLLK